jgi:hypothetical protein
MKSGQEIPCELIVSGSDAPEVLEPAEAAFDDISAFVGTPIESMDDDTVGFVGDDGSGAATNAGFRRRRSHDDRIGGGRVERCALDSASLAE